MQLNIKKKFKDLFRKMTVGQLVVFSIAFVLFALYAFSLLYALGWTVLASLRPRQDLMNNPFAFPESLGRRDLPHDLRQYHGVSVGLCPADSPRDGEG